MTTISRVLLLCIIVISVYAEDSAINIRLKDASISMAVMVVSMQSGIEIVNQDKYEDRSVDFDYKGKSYEEALINLLKLCNCVVVDKDKDPKKWIIKNKPKDP